MGVWGISGGRNGIVAGLPAVSLAAALSAFTWSIGDAAADTARAGARCKTPAYACLRPVAGTERRLLLTTETRAVRTALRLTPFDQLLGPDAKATLGESDARLLDALNAPESTAGGSPLSTAVGDATVTTDASRSADVGARYAGELVQLQDVIERPGARSERHVRDLARFRVPSDVTPRRPKLIRGAAKSRIEMTEALEGFGRRRVGQLVVELTTPLHATLTRRGVRDAGLGRVSILTVTVVTYTEDPATGEVVERRPDVRRRLRLVQFGRGTGTRLGLYPAGRSSALRRAPAAARTAPAPNIPPIPGLAPGAFEKGGELPAGMRETQRRRAKKAADKVIDKAVCQATSCGTPPGGPPGYPRAGLYTGTTDQGSPVRFRVSSTRRFVIDFETREEIGCWEDWQDPDGSPNHPADPPVTTITVPANAHRTRIYPGATQDSPGSIAWAQAFNDSPEGADVWSTQAITVYFYTGGEVRGWMQSRQALGDLSCEMLHGPDRLPGVGTLFSATRR